MRYLILLGVIAILAACASTGEEQEIVVKKRIETGLKIYKLAYRHAQNDRLADQKQNLWDHWASFVNSEIGDTLARRYGIRSYPSQENATDLIVEAKVRPGRGLPRFGRHFDLITEYIDFINIRFIDAKTGKTIGEVEYHRPSLADNPPYLIRTMIDRMVQGTEKPKGG